MPVLNWGKIGKGIDVLGRTLGNRLPELNVSERFEALGAGSIPQNQRVQQVQQDPRFGTYQASSANQYYPMLSQVPDQPSYYPSSYMPPKGDALGLRTTGGSSAPAGGAPAGGFPSNNPQDYQNLLEPAPQQPNFEQQYGSLFDQALGALDQQISARQANTEGDLQTLGEAGASQQAGIKGRLGQVESQLANQTTRETSRTEDAQNELRRQQAEMVKGIQARYGSTTGTGAFAEIQTSNQTMRLMAQNRQNLQSTLSDIDLARTKTISEANNQIFQVEQTTAQLKREAKAQLDQDISTIKYNKSQIGVQRQQGIIDAVANYQSLVGQINQRNQAFKQDLFKRQQDFESQIALKKLTTYQSSYTQLQSRLERMVKAGVLTPQGLKAAETQMGYTPQEGENYFQLPADKTKNLEDIAAAI